MYHLGFDEANNVPVIIHTRGQGAFAEALVDATWDYANALAETAFHTCPACGGYLIREATEVTINPDAYVYAAEKLEETRATIIRRPRFHTKHIVCQGCGTRMLKLPWSPKPYVINVQMWR